MLTRQCLLANLIEERRAPKNTEHLDAYTAALAAHQRGMPTGSYVHVGDVTHLIRHYMNKPTGLARTLATRGGALSARRRAPAASITQLAPGGRRQRAGKGTSSFRSSPGSEVGSSSFR